MNVPFNTLPGAAKIWIYQSNRPITVEEQEYVSAMMSNFVNQWQAHGKDLRATYYIFYNRFLVIGVDETGQNASGCSIDSSVHTLQEIEKTIDIDLFDRMSITFKDENGLVVSCSRNDFKEMIAAKEIDDQTIVFNNMVTTKAALDKDWEVKAVDSWHARMFVQNA